MIFNLDSILMALVGGVMLGVASALLLLFLGRVAGISGITAGLVKPTKGDFPWRMAFVGGMAMGGVVLGLMYPQAFPEEFPRGAVITAFSGLLVGFGTQLGSGCTSGHGMCGISRMSARSIVATATFIASGAAAVVVLRLVGVGA